MPSLSITKNYNDGDVLLEADLDIIRTDITDFMNSTKIDSTNIQNGGIATANYADLSVSAAKIAAEAVTKAKIEASQQIPPGVIWAYSSVTPPSGWLYCNGQAVSRTTYADLFAVTGEIYGEGDNATTFNVPDFRGRFLRGMDGAVARDPDASSRTAMNTGGNTGDNIGSVQTSQYTAHTHAERGINSPLGAGNYVIRGNSAGGEQDTLVNTGSSGGNETRPINAYVSYIIKT